MNSTIEIENLSYPYQEICALPHTEMGWKKIIPKTTAKTSPAPTANPMNLPLAVGATAFMLSGL
jgi:hypothetical protein